MNRAPRKTYTITNKTECYVIHLHNIKDFVIKKGGKSFIFNQCMIDMIKAINSPAARVVLRRYYWLSKFNLNMEKVYGVDALNIDKPYNDGQSGSLVFDFDVYGQSENCITEVKAG